jgi:opacity protein-like surface antigen
MKKTILFAVITSAISVTFSNNLTAQKGFYVSAHGGPLLSVRFNGSDADNNGMDYKAKSSVAFGIGAGYNFTDHFGMAAEALYSKEKQRYEDHSVQYDEQLNFIKIPVVFTYNTNPSARIILTAKAGPQLGIVRSAKISNSSITALNGDGKDRYKDLTFGAMIGTGARIRLTNNLYADAGLRFDGTISNLESKEYREEHPGRSKTHAVNAGVEFGLRYFLN